MNRSAVLSVAWVILLLAFTVSLTACSVTADKFPERKRSHVNADIYIVDKIPSITDRSVLGTAMWSGSKCTIYVRSDIYPYAMTHELMHCFSGNWHDGAASSEYQHIVD